MKYALFLFVGLFLVSCGTPVPLTDNVRNEFGLDNETAMAKVQFLTSATIILERSKESGNQGTTSDGTLIQKGGKFKDWEVLDIKKELVCIKHIKTGKEHEINMYTNKTADDKD